VMLNEGTEHLAHMEKPALVGFGLGSRIDDDFLERLEWVD